jgi:predicted phage-related endonuclease
MRSKLLNATLFSLVCAVTAAGHAQDSTTPAAPPAPPTRMVSQAQEFVKSRFADADANHDGKLTREEAKGRLPMVYDHFDEIDTAHKGSVTLDQVTAYFEKQRMNLRASPPNP